jgi:hypothetical protein
MDMDRFNVKKLNEGEVKGKYQVTTKNRFFSSGELKRITGSLIGHGILLERI